MTVPVTVPGNPLANVAGASRSANTVPGGCVTWNCPPSAGDSTENDVYVDSVHAGLPGTHCSLTVIAALPAVSVAGIV